jgi:hypothetical protein
MIDNLRFPKVFVFNPSSEIVFSNAVKPDQLTSGQVGFFASETGTNPVGVGTLASVTNVNTPVIEIHQNLGDTKFGTTRTKQISAQSVRRWYASKAVASVPQRTYIGYNATSLDLSGAKVGDELVIVITIYDNELRKFWGDAGYTKRIIPNPSVWAGLNDGDPIPQLALATDIAAQVNGTDAPANAFPTQGELKNFITATVVNSGAAYGVRFDAIAVPIELIDKSNPRQFYKPNVRSFTVATSTGYAFPVTTTQKAVPGTGYPLEVTDLEKESQGYDRVRNSFEYNVHMTQFPYVLRAADATKYDFYTIEFEDSHAQSGLPKRVQDPSIVIFAVPTGTGANLETLFNAWLSPLGFAAVSIAASTGKGSQFAIGNV